MEDNEFRKTKVDAEFEIFMNGAEISPPENVRQNVLSQIHRQLEPHLRWVLTKVLFLYSIAGSVVLLFCPQFGIALQSNLEMPPWFAQLGPFGCMAACGGLFLGSGALLAAYCLRPEELRKFWSLRYVYYASFALLSLFLWNALGAEIILGLGSAWFLGSFASEVVVFELVKKLRLTNA